jgi:hypothetical protein
MKNQEQCLYIVKEFGQKIRYLMSQKYGYLNIL